MRRFLAALALSLFLGLPSLPEGPLWAAPAKKNNLKSTKTMPPTSKWVDYLPVLQDPERGQYFINTRTVQRQGDVFFFQYRNIISPAWRNRALESVKPTANPADRKERLKIRRWAYSIVSAYYNAEERTARLAVSAAYSRLDELLTRQTYNQPFTPVEQSPVLNALCSALMDYVAEHPVREFSVR